MANPENLEKGKATRFRSGEEAANAGRKGGKASGEAKRRRKAFAEALDMLLARDYTDHNGNQLQGVEAIAVKLFQQAMNGDLKAIQIIRDTVGEMPVQRIETVNIPPETYERVQGILDSFSSGSDTGVQPTEGE